MFQLPEALLLLSIIPILMVFLFWRELVRRSILRRIGDEALVKMLTSRISTPRRVLKAVLWLTCITLLILTLAQPAWGTVTAIQPNRGIRVIFAVDTSSSMDVRDTSPSRMERLKLDLSMLLQRLEGNEVAIVAFAHDAFLYLPFTSDTHAAQVFTDALSTDMVSSQGTNIASALEMSLSLADEPEIPAYIFLLTDGENHEPDTIALSQIAASRNIRLIVLGYGTVTGGPVPVYDRMDNLIGYKTLGDGTLVNSSRNDTLMERIASQSGGVYLPMSDTIITDELFSTLIDRQVGQLRQQTIQKPRSITSLFLVAALIILSFEIIFTDSIRRSA